MYIESHEIFVEEILILVTLGQNNNSVKNMVVKPLVVYHSGEKQLKKRSIKKVKALSSTIQFHLDIPTENNKNEIDNFLYRIVDHFLRSCHWVATSSWGLGWGFV